MRLHPFFNTVEFRICDAQLRVDETIALAAVMQAIVVKLYKLMQSNLNFRLYRKPFIEENKWRAARYGVDAKLIDFGKQEEVPFKDLLHELVDFVDDVLDELGSRHEVEHLFKMLDTGSGADRQLTVFKQHNALKPVVDFMISETYHGLF
jgi:carboxylate-amine ligase